MNEAAASWKPALSCADQVLDLKSENDVQVFVQNLVRRRELSSVVKSLNDSVLKDAGENRRKAIAALSRIGLWMD
ncbi:MAG: hypothetical protein AAGB28_18625 [Pseudomonadota bacterium]